jgi:hypothetical protein
VSEASAPPPAAAEVAGWLGFEVDEAGGARVGRATGVFADAESGAPAWLVVALERRGFLGRRRPGPAIAVPARECAGAAGRVWVALGEAALRSAPAVDPARPLLREHELVIGAHYGIGEDEGRCAEVARRPQGAVTSS